MQLGIFGGTFDPVHYGHLLLAETCREQCQLDQVWFLPAAVPPHKRERELTAAARRVEMLELAIGGHEPFRVCRLEAERGGVNYTAQTLATIHAQQPDTTLYFLMGADSLRDLPTWYEPQRICELAIVVAVRRAGAPEPNFTALQGIASPERLALMQRSQVEMPILDLSSTDLRRRAATQASLRFRTPRAVEKYIETHALYRPDGMRP